MQESEVSCVVLERARSLLEQHGVPISFAAPNMRVNGVRSYRLEYAGALSAVVRWRRANPPPSACPPDEQAKAAWNAATLPALRQHQERALQSCMHDGGARSGVVNAPPGWGKTILALHYMRSVGGAALVVTSNRTLVNQWAEHLRSSNVPTYRFGDDGADQRRGAAVVLCTYHCLVVPRTRKLQIELLEICSRHYSLVVYDEVHVLPAQNYRGIADTACTTAECFLSASHKLGLTGTMIREDGLICDLEQLVGPTLYSETSNAALTGLRVEATLVRFEMHDAVASLHRQHTGANKRLCSMLNPVKLSGTPHSLDAIVQRHSDEKLVVFVNLIAAIPVVLSCIRKAASSRGGQSAIFGPVSGSTSSEARALHIDRFRRSQSGVLLTTDVLSLGTDVRDISVVVEMSADISRNKYVQHIGRAWRQSEGKSVAYAYTLVSKDTHEDRVGNHRRTVLSHDVSFKQTDCASAPPTRADVKALSAVLSKRTSVPRRYRGVPNGLQICKKKHRLHVPSCSKGRILPPCA